MKRTKRVVVSVMVHCLVAVSCGGDDDAGAGPVELTDAGWEILGTTGPIAVS